ncbi:MAG: sensor histidine kinase [Clostridia bacterium]|nr:sensor histidine kinase [Clostridia bacterium]
MLKRETYIIAKKSLPGVFIGMVVSLMNYVRQGYFPYVQDALKDLFVWSFMGFVITFVNYFSIHALRKVFPGIMIRKLVYLPFTFILSYLLSISFILSGLIDTTLFSSFSLGIGMGTSLVFYFFMQSEKKDVLLSLQETQQELEILHERNRIAQDIHDAMQQDLFAIDLHLNTLRTLMNKDDAKSIQITDQLLDRVREIQSEMQLMIYELKPLDLNRFTFFTALDNLVSTYRKRYSLNISHTLYGNECLFHEHIQIAAYRIIQEALNNTVKHAQAKKTTLLVNADKLMLTVRIRDDGIGFDPNKINKEKCFGTTGMIERAKALNGTLHIKSTPGKGTEIEFIYRF